MTHVVVREQGFSTVELLISLFIAAAFIATGFQLFSIITQDSNKARLRTTAAGIASTTIQERKNAAGSTCGATPGGASVTNQAIATAQLPQATYDITYSCPYGTSAKTTRITVTIKYGNPQETVEGSLDVTR